MSVLDPLYNLVARGVIVFHNLLSPIFGNLVLADNVDQNDLLGTSRANAASLLPVHARMIKDLVAEHRLNRELEALPSEKEIARRTEAGIGLTSPELATLMAHVKLALKDQLLSSDIPDQEAFASRLPAYFPSQLRETFTSEIRTHQLGTPAS